MKIAIMGYSGCGKSTLAQKLGKKYGIPVLHLDRVQFLPGWQERDRAEAVALTASFMEQDGWVIDGNYTAFLQEERAEQADLIIYMAFGRFVCLHRAMKRYRMYRGMERDSMAEGCTEKMDAEFIWWILYKGRTAEKRRHYQRLRMRYPEKFVILRNQRELDRFCRENGLPDGC